MNINWKVSQHENPIIFHRTTQWEGMKFVHWRVRAGELQETIFAHHEISLPLKGQFVTTRHTATGRKTFVHRKPGTICVVPSGQPVSIDWADEAECVTLALDPCYLHRVAAEFVSGGQIELAEIYEQEDPLVWQIGQALLVESEAKAPLGRLYAETLANTLALHLLRHYSTVRLNIPAVRGGLSGRNLRTVTAYIDAHLAADLTIAELAASVRLSPYHFARAFKRATGLTPHQFLMQRRVEHAKQLLRKKQLSLVEVSAQVGFKNQSHFTTFFRRLTTVTPKIWRELHHQ